MLVGAGVSYMSSDESRLVVGWMLLGTSVCLVNVGEVVEMLVGRCGSGAVIIASLVVTCKMLWNIVDVVHRCLAN